MYTLLPDNEIHIKPAQAGTKEWLEASRHLILFAYCDNAVRAPSVDNSDDDQPFGTHIKETVRAFKNVFGRGDV